MEKVGREVLSRVAREALRLHALLRNLPESAEVLVVAARLRQAISAIAPLVVGGAVSRARAHNLRSWAQHALDAPETQLHGPSDVYWFLASRRMIAGIDASGVAVMGVNFGELDLEAVDLGGAILEACGFETATAGGSKFDAASVRECDFSRANLDRTSWARATVEHSHFAGAVLTDAILSNASFVDSDMRGADLAAPNRGAMADTSDVVFVRCDLRETNWESRVLRRTKLIECKLHGTHGRATTDEVEIVRPDLAPAGDGSRIGTGEDVLRRWRQ